MDAYETTIYIAVLITAIVVATILFFFAFSIIRQQGKNIDLYRQNIQAEISTLEKERTRMAKDLHDELGPMLSAIKLSVTQRSADEATREQQLNFAGDQIDEVIHRLRGIAGNLMPTILLRKGLVAAIREFIQKANAYSSCDIQFRYLLTTPLGTERELHIFRMIQEAVHNALKHAACTQVKLQIKEEKNQLYIACQDNGRGFSPQGVMQTSGGLGLINLQSRAEILGGKVNVQSQPGNGAFILITIPLSKSHET